MEPRDNKREPEQQLYSMYVCMYESKSLCVWLCVCVATQSLCRCQIAPSPSPSACCCQRHGARLLMPHNAVVQASGLCSVPR